VWLSASSPLCALRCVDVWVWDTHRCSRKESPHTRSTELDGSSGAGMAGNARAALVLGALGVAGALRPGPSPPTSRLLALRGGVQPAPLVESPAVATASARQPGHAVAKGRPPLKRRPPRRRRRASGLRDAASAALVLSTVGGALAVDADAMLGARVPGRLQGVAWLLAGGALSSVLYACVRLTNPHRAAGLCRLLLGGDELRSLHASALLFALGAAASMQSLPNAAG
jgi:hypothetical protein